MKSFVAEGLFSVGEERVGEEERSRNFEVLKGVFREKSENLRICVEYYEFLENGGFGNVDLDCENFENGNNNFEDGKNNFENENGNNFENENGNNFEDGNNNFENENGNNFENDNKKYFFTEREKLIGKKFLDIVKYLVEERKLTTSTLLNFEIGIGEEMFKDEDNNLKLVKCIYFPMKTKEMIRKNENEIITKLKIKGIGKNKKYLRVFPTGADFGFFGNIFRTNKNNKEKNENNQKINENENNEKINENENNEKINKNENNISENFLNPDKKIDRKFRRKGNSNNRRGVRRNGYQPSNKFGLCKFAFWSFKFAL